jgi:hypothetical protein
MPTMAVGLCSAGGRKQAGESCAVNADCAPGSQCFKFACGKDGKDIKGLCLRFCKNDGACGAQSSCSTPVPCGATPSGYKTCTPACDPRAPATKGCGGDGLRCFVTKGEGTACACAESTRTGGDGAKCDDDRQCEPGFICIDTGGALTCRAVCRLDAPECPAGRTCEKLTLPDYKIFGGCLPN